MRINLLITAVVGAFVALFPDVIMGIFNADAQTVAEGADFLRCLAADDAGLDGDLLAYLDPPNTR